jgi:hypothetical protein
MNDNLIDFGQKERSNGMSVAPEVTVRVPRRTRVIKKLHEGDYHVWPIDIAEDEKPFGIQITDESCLCCGGFFPKVGEIRGFWDEDRIWTLVHIGCLIQVGDWAES